MREHFLVGNVPCFQLLFSLLLDILPYELVKDARRTTEVVIPWTLPRCLLYGLRVAVLAVVALGTNPTASCQLLYIGREAKGITDLSMGRVIPSSKLTSTLQDVGVSSFNK